MPVVRFSPAFIRHVSCSSEYKKIDYFDLTMRGFMLEVRASGGKLITSGTRTSEAENGSTKLVQPTCSPYGRPNGRQSKSRLWQFSAVIRKRERQERRSIPTLRAFIEDRYLPFVRTYKRSWQTDEIVLRVHVVPHVGHLFLDEITTERIVEIVAAMRGRRIRAGHYRPCYRYPSIPVQLGAQMECA